MHGEHRYCRKKPTTDSQFKLMVTEVGKVPELETPLVGANRLKVDRAWKSITQKLNDLGPPTRKPAEWRKVWTDLKGRVKKRIANKSGVPTSNRDYYEYQLTPLEEIVDQLVQSKKTAPPSSPKCPASITTSSTASLSSPSTSVALAKNSLLVEATILPRPANGKKSTTYAQFDLLVKEVTKMPLLTRTSLFGNDRLKADAAWVAITKKLNELGPPTRQMAEWRKVWSDLKGRVRAKRDTSTGSYYDDLNPFEQLVADILKSAEVKRLSYATALAADSITSSTSPKEQEEEHTSTQEDFKEWERRRINDPLMEVLFDEDSYEEPKMEVQTPQIKPMKTDGDELVDAVDTLKDVVNNFTAHLIATDDNEDAVFARSIISLLRPLQPSVKDSLKKQIYNIIFDERKKNL